MKLSQLVACFLFVFLLSSTFSFLFLSNASLVYAQHNHHEDDPPQNSEPTNEPQPTTKAHVVLTKEKDDITEKIYLIATVSFKGNPVQDINVAFNVPRLFGMLTLGEATTDEEGVAKIIFPEEFPGNPKTGELSITAKIIKSKIYFGEITALIGGGTTLEPVEDPFPRAIWSPRTDWYLLLTVPFLIFCVWTVYFYALIHLKNIYKLRNK